MVWDLNVTWTSMSLGPQCLGPQCPGPQCHSTMETTGKDNKAQLVQTPEILNYSNLQLYDCFLAPLFIYVHYLLISQCLTFVLWG